MLPDYGLEDLGLETLGDDDDTFNDDTFGTGLGDEWTQGNEAALWDGAKAHEDFLAGDLKLDAGVEAGGAFDSKRSVALEPGEYQIKARRRQTPCSHTSP